MEVVLIAGAAGAVAGTALAYRAIWQRIVGTARTPSGFGLILAVVLLCAMLAVPATPPMRVALAITAAATAVYWLDDLLEIGAWTRIAIGVVSGATIAMVFAWDAEWPPAMLMTLALVAGLVNVSLVNIINFQDGADLNIAVLIALMALFLGVFAQPDTPWRTLAVALAIFVVPFAAINARPATLYFGDSGCFALAMLFTIMGICFLASPLKPPPEAAIPAALAVVDALFVTIHRVRIRQRFTVRHYFHLYQRLQRDRSRLAYLWPQIVNAALCVIVTKLLQTAAVEPALAVALAIILVTFPLFLLWRRFGPTGAPGPPMSAGAKA